MGILGWGFGLDCIYWIILLDEMIMFFEREEQERNYNRFYETCRGNQG